MPPTADWMERILGTMSVKASLSLVHRVTNMELNGDEKLCKRQQ